ncbi:hypothetical protein FOZ60_006072 [Perkinsus olseni]|uniref:Histone RNA hairpin-binding protein RNA-binding domain-containing protein n=2 Tax=Perkinsus olseni TaxID=32597 RepID=A0A7J6NPS6_PEROL|nr:hypothetical protein FOZ60_006072 [Perkinsus olseni]
MSQRASMERILAQREKQIGIAKMTRGYQNYVRHVRKCDRNPRDPSHPSTPRVDGTDSKRAFEGRLRIWKQALHKWDTRDGQPPAQHEAATSSQSQASETGSVATRGVNKPSGTTGVGTGDGEREAGRGLATGTAAMAGGHTTGAGHGAVVSGRTARGGTPGEGAGAEHKSIGRTERRRMKRGPQASCAGSKSADATPSPLYVSDEEPIEAWMQQGVEEGRWTIVSASVPSVTDLVAASDSKVADGDVQFGLVCLDSPPGTLLLFSSLSGGPVSKKAVVERLVGARLPRAVLSTVLTHVCLGVLFSAGNVASYVLAYYADVETTISARQIHARGAWIFALQVFLMSLSVPLGSCLKPSIAMFASGLLLAIAHALAATALAADYPFPYFLVAYSVIGGAGIGLGYTAPMEVLFKIAPSERRGLYSGITAASFGLGSFVFTQLQSRIVNPYGVECSVQDPNYAVLVRVPLMLRVVGGVLMTLLSIAAAVIPDEVAVRPPSQGALGSDAQARQDGVPWRKMIRTPHFWLLVVAFAANTQAITFVASTFKMLGTSLCGMTDSQLVRTWSLAAVVNAIGRVTTGILTTDPLYSLRCSITTFLVGMCWNAFVLGGTFVVMPLATASLFGRANFQKNYGVVFMAFGFSALAAAWVTVPYLTSTLSPSLQLAVIALTPTATAAIAWLLGRLPAPTKTTDDWVRFYTETNRPLVE